MSSSISGTRFVSRRAFLGGLVGTAVVAACSSGDDDSGDDGAADETTETTAVQPTPEPATVDLGGPAFTLGVASGDPLPDSVVLWTRLAPDPLEGGGMPDEPVDVAWEVATDDGFDTIVRSGLASAVPDLAHSVHVDVTGLEPDTVYTYRFRLGNGEESPAGRTRTMPADDASPERLRLAVTTCQDFTFGSYAAHRHLADDDVDLVLFLGDYVYEYAGSDPAGGAPDPTRRVHRGAEIVTLDDYRNRHALYRTDPDLQASHAAFPWMIVWDDHDVDNNYAADVEESADGPTDEFRDRRAAAYQAFYEHLPMRIDPPSGADVRIYRDARFGDLAHLFLLDVRQYGDRPPCRGVTSAPLVDTGATCAEREDPDGTLLGADQEAWLAEGLGATDARWTLVAQQVMAAGLDVSQGVGPPQYFLDSWDGHPAARTRFIDTVTAEGVSNPVVLTGDYHAAFVGDLKPDPFDAGSEVVATELIAPAISSSLFDTDYTAENPHIRYFEPRHGYLRCTVEPGRLTAEFRYISDATDPDATIETASTWVIEDGRPGATPV